MVRFVQYGTIPLLVGMIVYSKVYVDQHLMCNIEKTAYESMACHSFCTKRMRSTIYT